MPIDYSQFSYAAPPGTGVSWVTEACRVVGLIGYGNGVSLPFPKERNKNKLRISTVRHPCHWLRSVYDMKTMGGWISGPFLTLFVYWPIFDRLCTTTFDLFVRDYLHLARGQISKVFNSYRCDVRMRLEDMPWPLVQLFDSLGVPDCEQDKVVAMGKRIESLYKSTWNDLLFQQVMDSESELCAELDYF